MRFAHTFYFRFIFHFVFFFSLFFLLLLFVCTASTYAVRGVVVWPVNAFLVFHLSISLLRLFVTHDTVTVLLLSSASPRSLPCYLSRCPIRLFFLIHILFSRRSTIRVPVRVWNRLARRDARDHRHARQSRSRLAGI